jgi:methylmalonyl-CoA mutase cobalamin-binding subunit
MLYVLKMLGASDFEEMFGVGIINTDSFGGRQPVFPTDIFEMSQRVINENAHILDNPRSRILLEGRKFLIASTDVHAHAITVIQELLSRAGSEITNLGAEISPDQIAKAARTCDAEAILVSTHNGMALEYANRLKAELNRQEVDIPVVIGGILNQKVDGEALPVDVTTNLKQLGFYPSPRLGDSIQKLLENNSISKK